jgi:hypothetical protein
MILFIRVLVILVLFFVGGRLAKSEETTDNKDKCPEKMLVEPPAKEWKTEDILKIPEMNQRCKTLFSQKYCAVTITKIDEGKYDIECGVP